MHLRAVPYNITRLIYEKGTRGPVVKEKANL